MKYMEFDLSALLAVSGTTMVVKAAGTLSVGFPDSMGDWTFKVQYPCLTLRYPAQGAGAVLLREVLHALRIGVDEICTD